MAILDAVQMRSVNTRTLPEFQKVVDGYNYLTPGSPVGGYQFINAGTVNFIYPDAATLNIVFHSQTNDFTNPGPPFYTVAQGTVSSFEVLKDNGAPAFEMSNFDPFTLSELYADASTGLKTFPARLFADGDTLYGSAFDDVLFAFDGEDSVYGYDGNDELNGGDGSDSLNGGDGNDSIDGGADSDDIAGDKGADRLTGGTGKDYFIFNDGDTTRKASGRDTITDFSHAEGDIIDLEGIDGEKGGVDNDFAFIGKKPFHGEKGELRYTYKKKAGDVLLQGDTNGDGKADIAILVENVKKLKVVDFDL